MLTKEEFVKTHPDVRVGMAAYSIDGEKLGVIERVDEDNLMIERGWFFHKDFVIPYDDIEDIREDRVIVRLRREDLEEQRVEEGRMREESEFTGRTGGIGEYERGRETEEARIPVREEELEAEKRAKESEVGIRKEVRTETEHLEVPVQKEDVIVERVPAEESWTGVAGEKAFQEEEMRIPVKEEEVEVTKRPVVKEEVRVRKESRTETEPVSGEVRKEEVKIEPNKPAQKK
jgi:uncharacterized protein (TIGR02271 family)